MIWAHPEWTHILRHTLINNHGDLLLFSEKYKLQGLRDLMSIQTMNSPPEEFPKEPSHC